MQRILIGELQKHIKEEVLIKGSIATWRDQGKMVFFDIEDMSGSIQGVVLPNHGDAIATAKELRQQDVVSIEGIVNERPLKNVNQNAANGKIELEITAIKILSKSHEIPFALDADVNLDTRFDNRPYTLRSERDRDIFKVQATIVEAYRETLRKLHFTEFQAPALVGGDAEGGAAVFKVEYYNDHTAFLATSPQLYKQMLVGVFERPFTIAKIFRAEKSATTRHLSELTQMDFEMGFIEDEFDVIDTLESVIRSVVDTVAKRHSDVFTRFNVDVPALGKKFPVLTIKEVFKTLNVAEADDLEPEHERLICEWAKREHDCDFVFITKFPTKARAFYTMSDDSDPNISRGFDLLFRGLEINSGAQRIHQYDELVERIKSRGMDPEKFAFYLQAFKYALPPHGGCSTGLERFTARMLNLANVKEASIFPRDMNRIDSLLSK